MMRMPLHQHGVTTKNASGFQIRSITICSGNSYAHKLSDDHHNLQSQLATAKRARRTWLGLLVCAVSGCPYISMEDESSSAAFCETYTLLAVTSTALFWSWEDHLAYTSLASLDAPRLPWPMLASYKGWSRLKIEKNKVRKAWDSMLQFVVLHSI
jgi:hypothetical protein